MPAPREDRERIRYDYVVNGMSMRALIRKYKVSGSSISRWARADGWTAAREQLRADAKAKAQAQLGCDTEQAVQNLVNTARRCLVTADALLDSVDELLRLGHGALAPRDLKCLSGVVLDCMTIHSTGKRDEAAETSSSAEWTVNIVNQDWGDEDAQH